MDDLLDALARLETRLEHLERRVSTLEHSPQPTAPPHLPAAPSPPGTSTREELAVLPPGGVIPVIGRAMLGIAGAYVLRAIAESGSFPKLAVVALALAYAGTWLVWAAHVPVGLRFARGAYAITSALILAPMVVELTLRFQILSAWATSVLLSTFVVAAFALGWKRDLAALVWVAEITAVLTALTLLFVSHDLAPYLTALLLVALAGEVAAARNRWLPLRFVAAPAVDIAVWILVYIHSLPEASRLQYAVAKTTALLALPSLLFLIYGAGIVSRNVVQRHRMTIFEIAQAVIAFVLAAVGWLWFAPAAGRTGLGLLCWLLAAACYASAFRRFDSTVEQRNYHVFATWGIALILAASLLVLPPLALALFLSVMAVVVTVVGVRAASLTLEFHGLVYLAAAAFASGLLEYGARALAGTFPAAPSRRVWIVAAAALLCCAICGRLRGERWNQRLLRLLSAIVAVSAAATFLVSGIVWLTALGMTPSEAQLAVFRTLITCALALTLAFTGARWERVELVWVAYGTLALVTAKLLFEDLPQGHSGSIAISIFLYAVALIVIPRLARPRRQQD